MTAIESTSTAHELEAAIAETDERIRSATHRRDTADGELSRLILDDAPSTERLKAQKQRNDAADEAAAFVARREEFERELAAARDRERVERIAAAQKHADDARRRDVYARRALFEAFDRFARDGAFRLIRAWRSAETEATLAHQTAAQAAGLVVSSRHGTADRYQGAEIFDATSQAERDAKAALWSILLMIERYVEQPIRLTLLPDEPLAEHTTE